jgi:phosphotransferase system enzyme I (PtsI)
MELLKGISASHGVVIGEAVVLDPVDYRITRRTIGSNEVDEELSVLNSAFECSAREVELLRKEATEKLGTDTAQIFDFHLGMLTKSPRLRERARLLIEKDRFSAARAVQVVMQEYQSRFRDLHDSMFAARARDVRDVEERLLRHLLGEHRETIADFHRPVVVIAHDLAPSQTAQFDSKIVIGLATDVGGATSHTAIIAHSLRIPAVVGLKTATARVTNGDTLVVDGTHGVVVIRPDDETLARYRETAERFVALTELLRDIRDLPSETKDGTAVVLLGNIEFDHEAALVVECGGAGVGLYRTEFLYLSNRGRLTEEQHYEAYRRAGEALGGRVLTIRTIDVGADKYAGSDGNSLERNPVLGLRSIRYCLQNLPMFKTQLRAILRAAEKLPIRVMFPLVTNLMELRQAKMVLGEAMEDLEEAGVEFGRDIPVGIMIETPAAALQAAAFAKEVDFFSIGTNDLVQYTLAVDRANERVAPLFSPAHPAVLRLLRETIKTARSANIDCAMCGEMASEPIYTMLLLGMGLRAFSVAAGDIPEIKKLIRSTTVRQCERIFRKAMTFDTDRQVTNYVREETKKILPEVD